MGTLSHEKIEDIHKKIDKDHNGTIEYSEFLAHSLTKEHLSEQNVRLFFDMMLPAKKDSDYSQSPKTRSSSIRSFSKRGSFQKKNFFQINTQKKQLNQSPKQTQTDLLQIPSIEQGEQLTMQKVSSYQELSNSSQILDFNPQPDYIDAELIQKYF